MNISNCAAIVTGGASGLGAASARALAAAGARVTIFDLNAEQGTRLAHEIGGLFHKVNVTSDADVESGFAAARAAHGQERILLNCAGTGNARKTAGRDKKTGEIRHFPLADFARIIDINLIGTFRCIALSAAGMLTLDPLEHGERGVIINTASVMAEGTDFGLAAYCASKAGIVGLTRTLALELGRKGVTANAIMPGAILTGMTRRNFEDVEIAKVWEKKAALRRLGQPIDIARAALFLASDDAGFVTGQAIAVDGGLTLRI